MRTLRGIKQKRSTPVLLLIPDHSKDAKLSAFETGASAVLTKPVDLERLTRVVRLIVVRNRSEAHCNAKFSTTSLSDVDGRIAGAIEKIKLTCKERLLLKLFLFNQEFVVTKGMINRCLYPEKSGTATSVVDSHLSNLRKKLDALDYAESIYTVRGSGYVFMP